MWEDRVAVHVREDMLKSQMWRNSCIGEFLLAKLVHTVYTCCFFRFDASLKKLFVSCNYHVLFACLAPMVFKVNTANIQYLWNIFRYPDYARPTLQCSIDNHIFS